MVNYPKILKRLNYSKTWVTLSENAPVNECMHVLITSWLNIG